MTTGIIGTGGALPPRVVTNEEVGAKAGVDDAWIVAKTGIKARRYADADQATSDLATQAARRALDDAGLSADDIALLIVATSTPDHLQPATAAFVQDNLAAHNAVAFDVNAVCSGFVFALAMADRMLHGSDRALVIGADVYSRILDLSDRRTAILFGDGAGAAVVQAGGGGHEVISTSLHSFGALNDLITVPAGGSRLPLQPHHHETGEAYFRMQGLQVRRFVTQRLPGLVRGYIDELGIDPADIDHLVPHQANGVMLDELVAELGLVNARVHKTIAEYGNTGAASVGITLDAAARGGEFVAGDNVLLAAYGGGMAVGLALLRW